MEDPAGDTIQTLISEINGRRSVLIVAGAGASADSGVPTFRGSSRSWWAGLLGLPTLLLFGTPFGWKWLPWLAWPLFARFMRRPMRRAKPNAFHHMAAELHARGKNVLVVTQNVDGLFQRAGLPPDRVIEQHGTVGRNICCRCLRDVEGDQYCARCGGWPRPAALLFGDDWFAPCDVGPAMEFDADAVVIVAGLSGMVASSDPIVRRRRRGPVFNVNPAPNRYDGPGVAPIRAGCDAVARRILRTSK